MFVFVAVPPGYTASHNGPLLPTKEAVSLKEMPKFLADNPGSLVLVADTEAKTPYALGERKIEAADLLRMVAVAGRRLHSFIGQQTRAAEVAKQEAGRREYEARLRRDQAAEAAA